MFLGHAPREKMRRLSHSSIAVVKIGGSVLAGPDSYHQCARALRDRLAARPRERLAVVVSAERGATDELLALAQRASPTPDDAALDLLWSTGEVRSVALLTLHLHGIGVRAGGLDVQQNGLIAGRRTRTTSQGVRVDARPLRRALAKRPIVVVPGFLAWSPAEGVVSLGRGGSDLTAVLLAIALGASRCELIKDVAGYFDADPKRVAGASRLRRVSYAVALAHAACGSGIVQRQALDAAARARLPILVTGLEGRDGSVIADSPGPSPATRLHQTPVLESSSVA